MRKRKADRKNQFLELIEQIQNVSIAIHGSAGYDSSTESVDDNDLTLRRLEELQKQLQSLQMEKSDRLKQVLENLSALSLLCSVLGLDYKETVKELHPSLVESEGNYSISSHTLQQLESSVKSLRELKLQRRQRLQDLATMLLELWNLMDTPVEEQQPFQHVTCNIAASEDEITGPNMLSADFIQYVGAEVSRLEELKSSKMKELVLKKRAELDEICRKTHMIPALDDETEHLIEAIESGALDPASVLEQMELEVSKVKEEAFSRKDILEKVEKWLSACEEEEWLEQYNMDENRYNAGRGSHLILKRAEKARTIVNKLPGMVEALAAKTQHWEEERGLEFLYDGVHLLSMLEEYITLRQDKEQEKKRQREQKKLQGQLMAEQEVLFGSKPSPMKSAKKSSRVSAGGGNGRRVSVGGNAIQTPRPDSSHSARGTPNLRPSKRDDNMGSQTGKFFGHCHISEAESLALASDGVPFQFLWYALVYYGSSCVQRVLDKNFTFNGRETEPAVVRRPFSPISSTASTRAHEDFYDDDNNAMQQQTAFQKETSQQIFTTPSKNIPAEDEENWTPKMHIPEPATPSTASAPMHTSMTPAPLHQPDFHDGDKLVEETDEEVEYSFEERRAGFVLPNTHLKRVIQV
uniref:Uncharacterized protein n=1 Tax=Chenopodium quinoa TaxID=63459 RepID=A0A803MTQ9_CHEQI